VMMSLEEFEEAASASWLLTSLDNLSVTVLKGWVLGLRDGSGSRWLLITNFMSKRSQV